MTTLLPATRRAFLTADAVRLLGAASLVISAVARGPVDAALFALVLGGLLIPRLLRVPAGLDAAYGVGLLVAAWSGALDLYDVIGWLDLAVHMGTTGLVAAVAYLAMVRTGAVIDPRDLPLTGGRAGSPGRPSAAVVDGSDRRAAGVVVLAATLGLGLSVIWEVSEYLGHTYLDDTIYVEYVDTVGDMAIGGLGSAIAGVALTAWGRRTTREAVL